MLTKNSPLRESWMCYVQVPTHLANIAGVPFLSQHVPKTKLVVKSVVVAAPRKKRMAR